MKKSVQTGRGITILMALLLLLVASMVSVVSLRRPLPPPGTSPTTARASRPIHRQLRCGAAAGRYPLLRL